MLTLTHALPRGASSMPMRLVLSVGLMACVAVNAVSAQSQGLTVVWTGQRMNVSANGVPLSTVLTEVARQTGSSIIGLEQAADSVTVDIQDATLRDALRTLLAAKNYIYIQRYSENTHAYDRVKLWLYGTSAAMASARSCVGSTGCDNAPPGVVSFEGAIVGPTSEPFPRGPSPAEAEAARLQANGAFNPDASQGSLLTLAKSADPVVRIRALQTLAVQNSNIGFEAINVALSDEHPFVRAEALELVLNLRGPGAEAARQIATLAEHRSPEMRASAALALGDESGDDAEFLLQRLLNDEDESVRSMAAQQLRQKESQTNRQQKVKR